VSTGINHATPDERVIALRAIGITPRRAATIAFIPLVAAGQSLSAITASSRWARIATTIDQRASA
jgi:hypothetical protein